MTDEENKPKRVIVEDPRVQQIVDALPYWQELVEEKKRKYWERQEFVEKVFGKVYDEHIGPWRNELARQQQAEKLAKRGR